jgi:hypothetical protein
LFAKIFRKKGSTREEKKQGDFHEDEGTVVVLKNHSHISKNMSFVPSLLLLSELNEKDLIDLFDVC